MWRVFLSTPESTSKIRSDQDGIGAGIKENPVELRENFNIPPWELMAVSKPEGFPWTKCSA
jgi:hypothetical protein